MGGGREIPHAEADVRAAWADASAISAAAFLPRSRRGSYLDPSISRTLFASAAMLNGFVSTDIPTSN
jgi:hypothetical protein